ncbi:hypothetical protein DL765_005383 [Monosporascus sp. GIB2]|nr:hypothetical protein DL765_005383 [Monosporascus sp. GIB2]
MRVSTTLVAMAIGVYASPTPNSLFKRQEECAAVNQACLSLDDMALLTPLGPVTQTLPGFSLGVVEAALTCCPGSTCTGPSVALPELPELPAVLVPLANPLGNLNLPYQSCTNE